MADDGENLHDPWAPPPTGTATDADAAAEPELDAPTRVTPLEPSPVDIAEPLPPFEPVTIPDPTPPPPPPPRRRWPGSAKAIVILLVILLIGTAAALSYGWYKTNEDKKDLEHATTQQGQELSGQLDKSNQDLAASQQQLTDANAKVTDLQGQLSDAQKEADAAKAENDALTALFPMNAQKLQPGVPGSYRTDAVNTATGGCSLAPCPSVQLTLTIAAAGGGLTASDPALGQTNLTLATGGWTAGGSAPAALQLQCNGAPQPTTYTLSLAATEVALASNNAPQVTILSGALLLSSAAVPAGAAPTAPACPPGVASYVLSARRT
jgi:TolA-binding protein